MDMSQPEPEEASLEKDLCLLSIDPTAIMPSDPIRLLEAIQSGYHSKKNISIIYVRLPFSAVFVVDIDRIS